MAKPAIRVNTTEATKAKWEKLREELNSKNGAGDLMDKILSHWIATGADTETKNEDDGHDLSELENYISTESIETGIAVEQVIASIIEKCKPDESTTGTGKVAATIREMMVANVAAKEWYDRLAITAATLFRATGTNQGTIRKYLKDNIKQIETHHTTVGIEDATDHNRKVGVYMRNAKNK